MTTTPTFWGTEITFTSDFSAFNPQVVGLTDGTFAIAWETGTELFARHLNELGSFTGGNFLSSLSSNTTQEISNPKIFQQANGSVVVNFILDADTDPGPLDIERDVYWHIADADIDTFPPSSNKFGTEKSVFDEILLDATSRSDGVGGFGSAIAYLYTGPGDITSLVVRFVDAFGNQASNQIFIPDPGANDTQQNAALAGRHTGHVVVAYENFHFDPNPSLQERDIRFHIYAPNETDVSGEVVVSSPGSNAGFPDVASLIGGSTGNFVVVWQQAGGAAFRRYFANGTALDSAPVSIPGSAGAFLPKITPLNDGGFIVAWSLIEGTESDGSPDLDIAVQRFNGAGTPIGARVDIDKPGDQGLGSLSIATLADGRVIVTYGSETGNATNITTLNYQIVDPRENLINATNGVDNYVGREDGSTINGFNGDDKLTGREAADRLNGGQGDDTLRGFGGNDILDGGTEHDTMSGGLGNDAYRVDNVNDVVIELAGEGTDNVNTTVSYGLATGVSAETLRVLNAASTNAINLAGNEIANFLTGNAGANALNGRGGVDTMRGLAGNDIYIIDISGDKALELANQGTDTARTTVSYALAAGSSIETLRVDNQATTNAINLTGNELVNGLLGNNGANALDGKGGADAMRGFLGNDIYIVDNAGDKAIELTSQGTDTVRTTVSFTLASGMAIETLRVFNPATTSAVNLTGNQLVNALFGNAGVNILDGKAGADTAQGLGGNDSYFVDVASDKVIESTDQGSDTVRTSVSYALLSGSSVELLQTTTVTGTTAINLTGNQLANVIIGNNGVNGVNGGSGDDQIFGKSGKDTLTGGAGSDFFQFDTPLNATTNLDTITDYSVAADTMRLENAIFTTLAAGTLAAAAFHIGAAAADPSDRIIYNSATGALFYDTNGNAAGGSTQFAKLAAGLALTNAEFVVV